MGIKNLKDIKKGGFLYKKQGGLFLYVKTKKEAQKQKVLGSSLKKTAKYN